ncbi:MAG: DoxX family protein [Bacteroidota bacterium]|nr:DoxX family protein [Bacteroidota bacterium]MDX5431264.1 DoxX family protein [Bacteroidota bacterium]MDX5470003.1 DoxX family protein [Bacteroidota bacterium]
MKRKSTASLPNSDLFLLVYRLLIGFGMIYGHGWPKLMRLFSGQEIKFYDFLGIGPEISLGLAVFAECLMAAFVMLGLWSRWASVPVIFTMLVAALGANWNDGFQGMEKALMYAVMFAVVLVWGPGKYALDTRFSKK